MPSNRASLDLAAAAVRVQDARPWEVTGRVVGALGPLVEACLPGARVGTQCSLGRGLSGEVVGFREGLARLLVLGSTAGLASGSPVRATSAPVVHVGSALLGRVLDGLGRPMDGLAEIPARSLLELPLERSAPDPLKRQPVTRLLSTGVRAIDAFCPVGHGQRIGLFAGPGVGKSTLLADLASWAEVDVVVVALVGERGREVRELLDGPLRSALHRSVVVVETGDAPAMLRARAALSATTIAEHFRDLGLSVLLLFDSLTRYARALREVGLSAGEQAVRGGFPPSVFNAMQRLLERSGPGMRGAITAVYTVLCEDEGAIDPIADEVKGLTDGHILLSKRLAERSHWPAIDVPASLSRLATRVASGDHLEAASVVRRRISAFEERRELVVLGAYRGGDPEADEAVASWPETELFLRQPSGAPEEIEETQRRLMALAGVARE